MTDRILKLIKPEKDKYITALIATVFYSVFTLVTPLVVRYIIDYVLSGMTTSGNDFYDYIFSFLGDPFYYRDNIWICSLIFVAVSVLQGISAFVKNRYTAIGAENIAKLQKDNLYDHLQHLPYDYHVKAQTGDLIQRCTSDVDTVRRFFANMFMEMFRIIITAAIAFSILITFNVKLTFVSVVIVPIIFVASYYFMMIIRRTFLAADAKEGELSTVMQENFTGVRVVRAFGREKFELEKFRKFNKEFKQLNFKSLEYMAKYWGGTDLLCFAQISLVVVVGSLMAYNGEISLGTLFVFTIYVNSLVWPLRQLGRILSHLGRMEVALTRINEILNTQLEDETKDGVKPDLRGEIVFNNVDFGYEQGNSVLNNMSFTIKPGEKIAVLGSTGSGKSSLMHLLMRLYDYNNGSVTINGTELKDINKKYLRERVGIVLQEPFLYSKTIMENIKMAKDEVSDEQAYSAAKTASIHDVILGFKEKYDTVVGERGVTLSGGQKQRLAIARTLVKNSDILIFDDSLSAVDTETDMKIQAELKENSKGITTFIISQRITTLMDADRIFVMENGRLADSGSHEELISRDGLYYRVWNIQNTLEEEFESEDRIDG